MRIALLGASGRTGRHVLSAAAQRGHEVSVLVRDPARLPADLPLETRVVVGDSTSPTALAELVKNADVVLSTLGPTGKDRHLHGSTAHALVSVRENEARGGSSASVVPESTSPEIRKPRGTR